MICPVPLLFHPCSYLRLLPAINPTSKISTPAAIHTIMTIKVHQDRPCLCSDHVSRAWLRSDCVWCALLCPSFCRTRLARLQPRGTGKIRKPRTLTSQNLMQTLRQKTLLKRISVSVCTIRFNRLMCLLLCDSVRSLGFPARPVVHG